MPQKRLKVYHLDIYEDESDLLKKAEWLKEQSGVKSDTEFMRWTIVQLERRIKDELEIIAQAKEAIKTLSEERSKTK